MQPGAITLYDSVSSSNIQPREKSALLRWFEKSAPDIVTRPNRANVRNSIAAFRQTSESLIAGALLGLAHAELPNGLDAFNVPMDAALGGLLMLGSTADSEYSADARNIGAVCVGVFTFRTTTQLRTEMRIRKGNAVPKHLTYGSKAAVKIAGDADIGADPILQAAKALKNT